MKDQYFGDVNDFRKYGLLRLLALRAHLRLGVCWMLTEGDGSSDGRFLEYLEQPKKHRCRDEELFDWLKQVLAVEKDRRTALIEASTMLGTSSFQSTLITDCRQERKEYFADCAARFAGCDLVFLDPDNGFEVKSTPAGRKNSCKFVYWPEVSNIFAAGSSLLVYQHFIRSNREQFIAAKVDRLRRETNAAAVFSFRTPHVVFLLAAQRRHAAKFRNQLSEVESSWGPVDISGQEC